MFLKSKLFFTSVFLVTLLLFNNRSQAQVDSCKVVVDRVSLALFNGDASDLSAYLNDKVELSLPGQTAINSRNHATMILKSFFKKNHPSSFYNVSKSYSTQGVFIVGTMLTESQRYRVSYLVKGSNSSQLIYQLSIEK